MLSFSVERMLKGIGEFWGDEEYFCFVILDIGVLALVCFLCIELCLNLYLRLFN